MKEIFEALEMKESQMVKSSNRDGQKGKDDYFDMFFNAKGMLNTVISQLIQMKKQAVVMSKGDPVDIRAVDWKKQASHLKSVIIEMMNTKDNLSTVI